LVKKKTKKVNVKTKKEKKQTTKMTAAPTVWTPFDLFDDIDRYFFEDPWFRRSGWMRPWTGALIPDVKHTAVDLIDLGKEYKVGPYGLAVTDITGIEKGYLFGPDYYEGGTPLEWGLGWTVAFDKGDFNGKEALLKRKKEGLKTKLVGFEVSDPEVVAATGDKLFKVDNVVGEATNATYGITVGKSIGRARVNIEYANTGEELEVEHKGKRTKVTVAKNYRWYDPENKRLKR